jgi:hypothetical protein
VRFEEFSDAAKHDQFLKRPGGHGFNCALYLSSRIRALGPEVRTFPLLAAFSWFKIETLHSVALTFLRIR